MWSKKCKGRGRNRPAIQRRREGSCVTLKIPLTLAIMDGMEVSVGDSIFTIPTSNIHQAFKVTREKIIHDADGKEMIECMGSYYPIVRLHQLYDIETKSDDIESGILVWVESSDKSYCLFLDELLGEQQVVVKPSLPIWIISISSTPASPAALSEGMEISVLY